MIAVREPSHLLGEATTAQVRSWVIKIQSEQAIRSKSVRGTLSWSWCFTTTVERKLGPMCEDKQYYSYNRKQTGYVRGDKQEHSCKASGVNTNRWIKGGDLHGLLIIMCYKREKWVIHLITPEHLKSTEEIKIKNNSRRKRRKRKRNSK